MDSKKKPSSREFSVTDRAIRDLSILVAGGPSASKSQIRDAQTAVRTVLGPLPKNESGRKDFGEKVKPRKQGGFEMEM